MNYIVSFIKSLLCKHRTIDIIGKSSKGFGLHIKNVDIICKDCGKSYNLNSIKTTNGTISTSCH